MKILVYADSAIFSGAESLLCEITAGLAAEDGFELEFVAPPENDELVRGLSEATGRPPAGPVPSQALPLAAFHLYDPRRRRAVRDTLKTVAADVMLLNLPSAEYGATPLLDSSGVGMPVVGLMHISGTMDGLDFRAGRIRSILARRAVSRLDSVCLLSRQAMLDYPAQWSPRGTDLNVIRMPAPPITTGDQAAARRSLGLPTEATLIGMAARMTIKQKGHDTLVEAASKLVADRPDLKFVIAGDGQDRAEVESMISRRGLSDHFVLLGQVSGMGDFLAAIDLIAIPSRFEGMPLIAQEALAAGVPGVASSVDGLCDLWPAEWRVKPGDPVELAETIGRLLDAGKPAQQDLLASGRSTMKQLTSVNASSDVAACLGRAVTGD